MTEKEILRGLVEEINGSMLNKKEGSRSKAAASSTLQPQHHSKHLSCSNPSYPTLKDGSSSDNVVVMGDGQSPTKRAYKTLISSLVPSSSLKEEVGGGSQTPPHPQSNSDSTANNQ